MRYTPPNTVTGPRDYVSNVRVIYNGGVNSFSVAKLDWDGNPCLAMRWNVSAREWNDPDKQNNIKMCVGMPASHGHPVWFVVPEEFFDENSEVLKQIKSKL
jgi:hypothetical protein